ncbi:MAG: hypothetical protein JNK87_12745 [Bryobacterales bacterium]|nr:hypothetical protein [Bryobacterales bacterium]
MMPYEFLEKYHNLRVVDPALGLNFTANIHMYVSGKVSPIFKHEYAVVISALKKKMGISGELPDIFYITGGAGIQFQRAVLQAGHWAGVLRASLAGGDA